MSTLREAITLLRPRVDRVESRVEWTLEARWADEGCLWAWWHGAGGHEALNRAPVCMQVALQDLQDRLVPL